MNPLKSSQVRVLILGTGGMASAHAKAYTEMTNVEVVAGVDTRADVLEKFCAAYSIKHKFTSLEDAIGWGEFDAVSNVTPDSVHFDTSMAILSAGKHVLCEKPLATHYQHARAMADAAEQAGVVNMVNLVYRDVAAMQAASSLVAAGDIGEVRHFEASYLQSWLTQPAWGDWRTEQQWLWRLSSAHGSHGALGDVGIHILDFATFVAGSMPARLHCRLKTFPKAPDNRIGDYVLDANDGFVLHTELSNGAIGSIAASRFASGHHNDLRLRLYGDKGGVEVLYENSVSQLRVCEGTDLVAAQWHEVATTNNLSSYQRFIEAIVSGQRADPDFRRGAELQKVLDAAVESDEQGRDVQIPGSGTGADHQR